MAGRIEHDICRSIMTRPLVCIVLLGPWAFRIRNMHTKLDGFNVFGKCIISN
jgi:hypothetical protein